MNRPRGVRVLFSPVGVIADDVIRELVGAEPQGRPVVVDLVPSEPRVFPVGRLDLDTEGLLLLTNDGDLTHRLTHPSFGVEKEYLASVEGEPGRGAVRRLREGVELDDGMTAPATVGVVSPSVLRIVIHEGRNRIVRRWCEEMGVKVERLARLGFGPVRLGELPVGASRPLTSKEIAGLYAAVRLKPPAER